MELHIPYTATERIARLIHTPPQSTDSTHEHLRVVHAESEAQRQTANDAALLMLVKKRVERDNALITSINNWIALTDSRPFHEYAHYGWNMFYTPLLRNLQAQLARHGYDMHPSDDDHPLICIV